MQQSIIRHRTEVEMSQLLKNNATFSQLLKSANTFFPIQQQNIVDSS